MNAMIMALMSDAGRLQEVLSDAADHLCLALEAEKDAVRTATEMKRSYEMAEAEVEAEAMLSASGGNAESRKASVKATIAKAQANGTLSSVFRAMNQSRNVLDNAVMAREQMTTRFRAAETAVNLQTAAIRLAFKWNDNEGAE